MNEQLEKLRQDCEARGYRLARNWTTDHPINDDWKVHSFSVVKTTPGAHAGPLIIMVWEYGDEAYELFTQAMSIKVAEDVELICGKQTA